MLLRSSKAMAKQRAREIRGETDPTPADSKSGYLYPGQEFEALEEYSVLLSFDGGSSKTTVRAYLPDSFTLGFEAEYDQPFADFGANVLYQAATRAMGFKIGANFLSMQVWQGASPLTLNLPLRFVAYKDSFEDVVAPLRFLAGLTLPEVESFAEGSNSFAQFGFINSPGPYIDLKASRIGSVTEAAVDTGVQAAKTAGAAVSLAAMGITTVVTDNKSDETLGVKFADLLSELRNLGKEAGGFINNLLRAVVVRNNIQVKIGKYTYLRSVVVKSVSQEYNVKCDEHGNMIDATVDVTITSFVNPTKSDLKYLIGWQSSQTSPSAAQAESDGANKVATAAPSSLESPVEVRPTEVAAIIPTETSSVAMPVDPSVASDVFG
jgi:hypothetical protein